MFGLGGTEIAIILVVALLIFGPNKLPEMGRTVGKMLAEFKRASADVEAAVKREMSEAEKSAGEGDVNALAADEAAKASTPLAEAKTDEAQAYDDDFEYEDDE